MTLRRIIGSSLTVLSTLVFASVIALAETDAFSFALGAGHFSDVPENPLYSPHIESLYNAHFITGDTVMGVPSGTFRPDATINRAEFTKITTVIRLAELYGINENWNGKAELEILEKVNDKLQYFYKCGNTEIPECSSKKGADIINICNVCSSIGGTPFTDVTEKEWGCEEEGICDPWFTQYVYYAVAKGFIRGDVETHSFKPYNQIPRIYALKMILADNGNTDPDNDARFQSLDSLADSRNSYSPKCLRGAEDFIRDNNGGDTSESNNLLKYAILADRLDLFGNDCSVFGNSTTPKKRADFLQKYLTRKEAPRYYALTTSYYPIAANPESDSTVNTASENKGKPASYKYEIPGYGNVGEIDIPEEDDFKDEPKTPVPVERTDTSVEKKTVTPERQETALPEKSLPDITDTAPDNLALTDEHGADCGIIIVGEEFNLLAARKGDNGIFYQYTDYGSPKNCRFPCEKYETIICKEIIALNTNDLYVSAGDITKKIRADKNILAEVAKQCSSSKTVCDQLLLLIANYDIDATIFNGCNGDNICKSGRILKNLVPTMNRLEQLFKKIKNDTKDIKPKVKEITKASVGDRLFKTSIEDVNIRAKAETKGYLLKTIPEPKTEITVIGPAVRGEYVDDYKTDRWYPVRCEECEDKNGNTIDKGYVIASLLHAKQLGNNKIGYVQIDDNFSHDGFDRGDYKITGIVLHATLGNGAAIGDRNNIPTSGKKNGIGAQYYVDRDGIIAQATPDYRKLHHSGYSGTWKNIKDDRSNFTIGIEIANYGPIKLETQDKKIIKKNAYDAMVDVDIVSIKDLYEKIWKIWSYFHIGNKNEIQDDKKVNQGNVAWSAFGEENNENIENWQQYNEKQLKSVVLLISYLEERYGLPKDNYFQYDNPNTYEGLTDEEEKKYSYYYYPKNADERIMYNEAVEKWKGIFQHHNMTGKFDNGPGLNIDELIKIRKQLGI